MGCGRAGEREEGGGEGQGTAFYGTGRCGSGSRFGERELGDEKRYMNARNDIGVGNLAYER